MTEAILTIGIFAVPILTAAVVEQHKVEKERRKREVALILKMEADKNFRWGMSYANECMKQRALNSERQQVDKELERYAWMV